MVCLIKSYLASVVTIFILLTSPLYADDLGNNGKQYKPRLNYKDFIISGEYGFFTKELDILEFQEEDKFSKLEKTDKKLISITYKPFKDWTISTSYGSLYGLASRKAEPFELHSNGHEYSAAIEYDISNKWSLSLSAKQQRQDPVVIDCYSFAGNLLGGNCEGADFRILDETPNPESKYQPVASIQSKSDSLGLMAKYRFNWKTIDWVQTSRFQYSKINSIATSPIYEIQSPILLNLKFNGKKLKNIITDLKLDLPQEEPWKTYMVGVGLGGSKSFNSLSNPIVLYGGVEFISAQTSNYRASLTRSEHSNNLRVDLGLSFSVSSAIDLNIRGWATTNYVLGYEPIAYNQRTSHLFSRPYGELAFGISVKL